MLDYDKLNRVLDCEIRNKSLMHELLISSSLSEIIIDSIDLLHNDEPSFEDNISLNQSLDIVNRFFKTINTSYSNQVQNIIKNEQTGNYPSVIFSKKHFVGKKPIDFSQVDEKGKVHIDYDNTLMDTYSIVHEMTHKLSCQYDINSQIKNILGEVPTITMEFLLEDYLKKYTNFSKEEIEKRNTNRFISTYKDAGCVLFEKELIELYLKYGKINEEILLNELNNKESNRYELYSELGFNYLKQIIESEKLIFVKRQRYVIGELFGLYIINQIKNDSSNIEILNILIKILGNSDLSFNDDINVLSGVLPLLYDGKVQLNQNNLSMLKQLYEEKVLSITMDNYRVF